MEIHTTFHQMESSPALREYAESKLEKLEKYFNGIIDVRVTFENAKNSQTAEVNLKGSGFSIRGEEAAADAYAALDLVIDKLSRQLRKQHDKMKDHKPAVAKDATGMLESVGTDAAVDAATDGSPRIVSRTAYPLKPYFTDDAIAEMEQSDDEFMLFVNAESNSVNAIFRRPDGNYGLVEPDR